MTDNVPVPPPPPKTPGGLPYEPSATTRAEVKALTSFGVPQVEIAAYLDIDPKTLRKYYREELDKSKVQANANVAKFLYNAASGAALSKGASHADCLRAAMFWAKTQMGYRETQQLDHTSSDRSMSPKNATLTEEQALELLKRNDLAP